MNPSRLAISYRANPERDAAAWFIPGADPQTWLAEVVQWGLTPGELTLYVVPRSARDVSPLGALVTASTAVHPAVSNWAVPYGRLATRLFLPVTAALSPPVTEPELAALLGAGCEAFVWHPTAGLVGFEPGEGRRFAQLLLMPTRGAADWGHAHPGVPLNQRLRSVVPTEVPGIEMILEAGRGDIGEQGDDLSQLPEAPGERGPGIFARLAGGAISAAARAGQWLLSHLPAHAAQPGWADRLNRWMADMARSARTRLNLMAARERELRRLLALLATDPERGLKYAIPFGGAHRGAAPPGTRLPERDVDFNLDRLASGGPVDIWDMSPQMQIELLREYRRLAESELHLGRHRRAAYIFAELVNDLAAAAGALVAGTHFREAAVLYCERLKQPLEAARCLEKGRLWAEALTAYAALNEFEKAGDMAQKIELHDEAAQYYRRTVAAALQRNYIVAAAQVLDRKLNVPDEALEQLLSGWTSPGQAGQCVAESFRLLGRLGRHDEAHRQLARFLGPEISPSYYRLLIGEVADVAQTYPDSPARIAAADTVQRMAASRLKAAPPDESRALLAAVRRLAPEDRLLVRDCARFLGRKASPVRPAFPAPRTATRAAEFVAEHRVRYVVCSVAARSFELGYYIAGFTRGNQLSIVRGFWNRPESEQHVSWPVGGVAWHVPVILEVDTVDRTPVHQRPVIAHVIGNASLRLPQQHFPNDDIVHGFSLPVASPPWATEDTQAIALAADTRVAWALSRSAATLVLSGYGVDNAPVASKEIELPPELMPLIAEPPVLPVPMCVNHWAVYVGFGDRLLIVRHDGPVEFLVMPGTICGLACSAPHTRRRLAITFESGGRLLWDEPLDRREQSFATSFDRPVAGFIKLGWLIVALSDGCEIYATNDRRLRLAAECRWPDSTPIAVLDTGVAYEFAVAFANGTICRYRIPSLP